ncbi:hypothetical protein K7432_004509 [Basidiobolus ranarum]|uniref:Uncharacterized protein n=1 Tax=Basidiobolus ranarum TaxID=34480 RepID=A0ABR2WXZ3_9FUNG
MLERYNEIINDLEDDEDFESLVFEENHYLAQNIFLLKNLGKIEACNIEQVSVKLKVEAQYLGIPFARYVAREMARWLLKCDTSDQFETICGVIKKLTAEAEFDMKRFMGVLLNSYGQGRERRTEENLSSQICILSLLYCLRTQLPGVMSEEMIFEQLISVEQFIVHDLKEMVLTTDGQLQANEVFDDFLKSALRIINLSLASENERESYSFRHMKFIEQIFHSILEQDINNFLNWSIDAPKISVYQYTLDFIIQNTFALEEIRTSLAVQDIFIREVTRICCRAPCSLDELNGKPQPDYIKVCGDSVNMLYSDNSASYEYRRPLFVTLLKMFEAYRDSSIPVPDHNIAVINSIISIGRHLSTFSELTCVFALIRTFCSFDPFSKSGVLETLTDYLENSIERYDTNLLILVLTFAWLAENEKAFRHINGYRIWIQRNIIREDVNILSTKRKAQFLFSTLSNMVPYQSSKMLQLNLHSFSGFPRWRSIVNDYITLLKTRLLDMGESIQLNKNTLPQSIPTQSSHVLSLEKLLVSFSLSSRIPQALLEAIVFRNRWYINTFLPDLMYGEPLEEEVSGTISPTIRASFVENLYKNGKIAKKIYDGYLERKRQKKLELAQTVKNESTKQPQNDKSPVTIDLASSDESPVKTLVITQPEISKEMVFKNLERLVGTLLNNIEDCTDFNLDNLKLNEKIDEIKTAIAVLLDLPSEEQNHHTNNNSASMHVTDSLIYDPRSHELYENACKPLSRSKIPNSLTTLLMNVIQLLLQNILTKKAKNVTAKYLIAFLDILRHFKFLHPFIYLNLYQSIYSSSTVLSNDDCLIVALVCIILEVWKPNSCDPTTSGFINISCLDIHIASVGSKTPSCNTLNTLTPLKALFGIYVHGQFPRKLNTDPLLTILCYVIAVGFEIFSNQPQKNLELLILSLESDTFLKQPENQQVVAYSEQLCPQDSNLIPREFVWKVAYELENKQSFPKAESVRDKWVDSKIRALIADLPIVYRQPDLFSWMTWELIRSSNSQTIIEHVDNMILCKYYDQYGKLESTTGDHLISAAQRLGSDILSYILRKEMVYLLDLQQCETKSLIQRVIEIPMEGHPLNFNHIVPILRKLSTSYLDKPQDSQNGYHVPSKPADWARRCLIRELQAIDMGSNFFGNHITIDMNTQFMSVYFQTLKRLLDLSYNDIISGGLINCTATRHQMQDIATWIELCFSISDLMNDPAWVEFVQLDLKQFLAHLDENSCCFEQFYRFCPTFFMTLHAHSYDGQLGESICCRVHNLSINSVNSQLQKFAASIVDNYTCEQPPNTSILICKDPYMLACTVHCYIEDLLNSAISDDDDQATRIVKGLSGLLSYFRLNDCNLLVYPESGSNEVFVCMFYEICIRKMIRLLSGDLFNLGITFASLVFGDTTFSDLTTFKLTFYKELALGLLTSQPKVLRTLSLEWYSNHSLHSKISLPAGLSRNLYLQLTLILLSKLEKDFGQIKLKYVAQFFFDNIVQSYLSFMQQLCSLSSVYYYPKVIITSVQQTIEHWTKTLTNTVIADIEAIPFGTFSRDSVEASITSIKALDPVNGVYIHYLWTLIAVNDVSRTHSPHSPLKKRKTQPIIEID